MFGDKQQVQFETVEEFINKYEGQIVGVMMDTGIIVPALVIHSLADDMVAVRLMVGRSYVVNHQVPYDELVTELPRSGKYAVDGKIINLQYQFSHQFRNGLNQRVCPIVRHLTARDLTTIYNYKINSLKEALESYKESGKLTAYGQFHFTPDSKIIYRDREVGTIQHGEVVLDDQFTYLEAKLC